MKYFIKINSIVKLTFIFVSTNLLLIGCGSKDINKQEEECKKQGNKFLVEKKMNYRNGKYELKGICKSSSTK